jgi:uncharacterized Ntn-hydrolase superfamily protein
VKLTYSIVARDEKTGEMGVAVQSHFFSVGSIVTWAKPGVGAVATQAMVDVRYGPLGLDIMTSGRSAQEALSTLLSSDPHADQRQVAMVDARGRVGVHTGVRCIPNAGHASGDGFSCQGNIMLTDRVWGEMKAAFERGSALPLAERMVSALEAAESAGGDARGRQSAAILVVGPKVTPNPWEGKLVELRIEDHPDPLKELKRLLRYQRAYEWENKGDERLTARDPQGAEEAYTRAFELVPEIDELRYWAGIGLLGGKDVQKGRELLKQVFAKDRNWVAVTRGLAKVKALPVDESVIADLLKD